MRDTLPADRIEPNLALIRAIRDSERIEKADLAFLNDFALEPIVLAAWFGAPANDTFDAIDDYLDETKFDARIFSNILVDSRISLPPRMRADPRYHAYFDNVMGRNMLSYRRQNGLLAGMPLKPENVAAEELRLAKRGLVPAQDRSGSKRASKE